MIYLDYTAHTPACKQAIDAFPEAETNCLGNANAHHIAGLAANQRMKDARDQIACLLHIQPEEVISLPEPARVTILQYRGWPTFFGWPGTLFDRFCFRALQISMGMIILSGKLPSGPDYLSS